MSDISGNGYGSAHDWMRLYTEPSKVTFYVCNDCGENFAHAYDEIPNIFQAMRETGVKENCETVKAVGLKQHMEAKHGDR